MNGTLVFSLVAGMSVAAISAKAIANLEYETVKHTAPVFHGDSIHAESRILGKRESRSKPDWGIIYVQTYNHEQSLSLTLKRKVLIPKTPQTRQLLLNKYWDRSKLVARCVGHSDKDYCERSY